MDHVRAALLKLLVSGVPLFLILFLAGEVNWLTALVISVVVGLLAYVLGDLIILPAAGNYTAALADGGLVLFLLYLFRYAGIALSTSVILYSVVALVLVEALIYHPYLKRLVTAGATGPESGDNI